MARSVLSIWHFKHADPAAQPGHVAHQLIARLDFGRGSRLPDAKAADGTVRGAEGFVGFGGEEVEVVGHRSSHYLNWF
jgi:hypothetical protein